MLLVDPEVTEERNSLNPSVSGVTITSRPDLLFATDQVLI